ncbi:hypothetical protein [Tautonia marina]|uniref:hypothetical protein n=1 Tax=Tautonia marina TaxID=2653855 RepID=UPI0012609110|nr:hypothetical protein [Tautonia marina]
MSRYDDGTASVLSELRHDFRSAADKGRDLFGIIVCDLIEVLDRPNDAGWGSRLPSVRPLTRYGSPFENHVWNRFYAWPDRKVLAAYYGAPERFDTWLALANRAYRATWDFPAILHNATPEPFPRAGAINRANAAAWLATVHRLAWVAPADETLSTCRMTEFRPGRMTQWYEPADWDAWARDRARAGGFPSDHPDTLPSCWYSTLPEGLDLFSASAEAIQIISKALPNLVPGDATPPDDAARFEAKPEAPHDLVTLNQAAGMVHRVKRTLEGYKNKGMPDPVVEGGGGRSALYDWKEMKPWLQDTFGVILPDTFPANRRNT